MTTVLFLFLFHAGLGLLLALVFVPEQAGAKFFKFCSATAAFMTAGGVGLLYRRFGLIGTPSLADYRTTLAAVTACVVFTVLYNRAQHFGWQVLRRVFLAGGLACGAAAVWTSAPVASRALVLATDATSILLLGAAASAMILGHWYLVVLDLPIGALRRLTVLLILGLVLRAAVVTVALVGPVHAAYQEARLVASWVFSPDGVFVWMRLLFGIAGPASLVYLIWKTVEIRSTQSATGILYVQLFLILAGELLAKHLRITAGLPL